MERHEGLLGFLNSQEFEKPESRAELGARPFITISRQAGAGGHSLAEALPKTFARRGEEPLLGWQWVDRAVCERLAADPRLGVTLEALLDERFRGRLEDYLAQMVAGAAPQLKVHHALFNMLRSLAAVGRVILLGRGGVCVTRGFPGGVHVRLVASRPARVANAARRFDWAPGRAQGWVDAQDKERRDLVKEYFRADIDDSRLYDAVFDSERRSIADIAEDVADLVLSKMSVSC